MQILILWSDDPIFYEAVWGDDLAVGQVIMRVQGTTVNPIDSIELLQRRFEMIQVDVAGLDPAFARWGDKSYFCGYSTVEDDEGLHILHERLNLLIPALADEHR